MYNTFVNMIINWAIQQMKKTKIGTLNISSILFSRNLHHVQNPPSPA
jgi:hypothetical protein